MNVGVQVSVEFGLVALLQQGTVGPAHIGRTGRGQGELLVGSKGAGRPGDEAQKDVAVGVDEVERLADDFQTDGVVVAA